MIAICLSQVDDLRLGEVQSLTESLPSGLHRELAGFSDRVLSQYKYIRVTLISTSAASIVLTILLISMAGLAMFTFFSRGLLAGRTALLVTHDEADVRAFDADILRLG